MSLASLLFWLALMLVLVVLNALFVAAEYALVKLRRTRVQELVDKGHRAARTVKYLQDNIGTTIAGTQLGITLMSLALGWVGENSIHELVKLVFGMIPGMSGFEPPAGLAFGLSFVLLSMLHVILGEQVPKSWSIRIPEKTALFLAPAVRVWATVTFPLIWVMNALAGVVLRLLGLKKAEEQEVHVHSADELEILIEASGKAGTLGKQESDLLKRALELKEVTAKEIMLPRARMDKISDSLTLQEVLAVVARTKHSKLPVYRATEENIIGILNTRDLFDWWHAAQKTAAPSGTPLGKDFRLSSFVRQAHFVPESLPAGALLELMRAKKIQMVIVVDEFGGNAGLITLEDLVEQLVGEIWDEYDTPTPGIQKLAEARWHLSGELTLLEVNKALGTDVTCSSCITIAGAVIESLKRVPQVGDSVEIGGGKFTVLEMNRNAIAKLEAVLLPPPPPEPDTGWFGGTTTD